MLRVLGWVILISGFGLFIVEEMQQINSATGEPTVGTLPLTNYNIQSTKNLRSDTSTSGKLPNTATSAAASAATSDAASHATAIYGWQPGSTPTSSPVTSSTPSTVSIPSTTTTITPSANTNTYTANTNTANNSSPLTNKGTSPTPVQTPTPHSATTTTTPTITTPTSPSPLPKSLPSPPTCNAKLVYRTSKFPNGQFIWYTPPHCESLLTSGCTPGRCSDPGACAANHQWVNWCSWDDGSQISLPTSTPIQPGKNKYEKAKL